MDKRRRVRSSIRKYQRRRTVKLMLLLTGVCILVSLIISVTLTNLPSFIERTISRQIEGEIERTVGKDVNIDELKGKNIDELKRKYKEYLKK